MGPKKAEKRSERGKEHVDRQEQSKYKFDPLHLEVKYPGTAILLLRCQEQPVLLAAAAALSKYGSKAKENLEVLFDLDIVESVIPLIEHEDLFIRRFAAKLLAEMILIPNVRNFLLESTYYISYFTNVLMSDKDVFMQEFSSWILAEISSDLFGAAQLLKVCPHLNFLFEKFQSPDPDVKRNNLQIMLNLLQDPVASNGVLETKDFNLNLIYDLYNSPYVEIQRLALNITADIVRRNQDERLQELFRKSNGLQALLKFLDNDEWQDLHEEVLKILCLASDNIATVELLHDIGGIQQILKYKEDIAHSKLFIEALDVAVRLTHTPLGRKALYAHGIVNHLLSTFEGNMPESIYEIGCHGIGMMTLHPEAAKELMASSCMKNILDILKNESLRWSTRQAAMFALNQLLKCNGKNGQDFLNMQGQNYLVSLMKQPLGKVTVEILNGAIECLTTIGKSQSLRGAIITADVMDALCASFQLTCPTTTDYKIACCNALSTLCMDQIGRSVFVKVRGPSRLYNLLCDVCSVPTRNAATQTIQLLCTDPVLANAFVNARYLNYMLKNRTTARIVPSWDTCIEALFDAHLPIKFAFTGRLSLHDVTQNGFYVLRRNVCPFPILDDIFRFSICPLEPVYVVNCVRSYLPESQETLRHSIGDENLSVENGDKVIRPRIFLSTQIDGLGEDQKFGGLQCDVCLHDYVELFKCKLDAAETKRVASQAKPGLANMSFVASRAIMLAKFVAKQMSGPDQLIHCIDHQLEIHLKEIKAAIETSVIPLGSLRIGSYLERALLFKVIADRVHLPAALVRGEYGKAWVEIAVPETKDPAEETSFQPYIEGTPLCPEFLKLQVQHSAYKHSPVPVDHRQTAFPSKLLKPNFIVDLIHSPGDLIPINSHRARLYREKAPICRRVCRDTPNLVSATR